MAKQHGDKLGPAREALGGVIRAMSFDGLIETKTHEQLQQSREDGWKPLRAQSSLADRVFGTSIYSNSLLSVHLTFPDAS
jgi:hypothetical protein